MAKIRVLFLPVVDRDNTNAQSLNVREIAVRFDPELFEMTLLYEREPDARLINRRGIRLIQLPRHGRSLRIFREMLSGYNLITYIDFSPASFLFVHLPRMVRRQTKTVLHEEAPSAQIINPARVAAFLYEGIHTRCNAYTAITDYVALDLKKDVRLQASHILPVGVDTAFFSPPQERTNIVPTVLFAGTLIERKGPQYVIDAAAQFPQAMFLLVGAGRDGFDSILQRRIRQLGLNNVKLMGPQTQSQLVQTMRESDIFLLPSRLEGIPKVTLEAAATGLPCIVFRDYETPAVIDQVTGFQVANPEEMMDVLNKLIADRSLREQMGAAACKHMEKFDWDVVAKRWERAYLEISNSATG